MSAKRGWWLACVLAALMISAAPSSAQVAPDLHWQTLKTAHFRVHFSPGLEPTARRAAGSAERAYTRLAAELHPPRGDIELVVADNLDVSNGYTTTFPTNRIVILARPTVDATALKFLDDWIDLVVSHELAHVFHLDRTRGWWRVGQWVFGRNPFLFPNQYTPSWLAEGIAVYYESRLTGSGRIEGTEHGAIARALALDGRVPRLNALSASTLAFPLGQSAYAYGALLVDHLARSRGPEKVGAFVEASSARTIPYLLNTNAEEAFGISFSAAYRELTDSIKRDAERLENVLAPRASPVATRLGGPSPVAPRVLSADGWFADRLRWSGDSTILFGANNGRDVPSLRSIGTQPETPHASRYLDRRNSLDITSPLADGSRVYAQLDFTDPYTLRSDLYLEQRGGTNRLTNGARLMQPDATTANSQLSAVAVQLSPGASHLVLVTVANGETHIAPLTSPSSDTIWSEPRWSHAGTRIAATRWTRNGTSEIAILDTAGRVLATLGRSHAVNSAPSWAAGDSAIYFTSDRTGRSELYRAGVATGKLERIASTATALYESEPSPDGSQLATLLLRGDGYHVAIAPLVAAPADSSSVLAKSHNDPVVTSDAPAGDYSAWPSVLPRYWLPAIQQTSDGATEWGFITSGRDALSRHLYAAQLTYEPQRGEANGSVDYAFAGFGNPLLGLSGLQEWDHYVSVFNKSNVKVGTIRRRRRFLDAGLTLVRPRVRTNMNVSVGGELEFDDYVSDPPSLFGNLTAASRSSLQMRTWPSMFVSAGFSNTRRPTLAISPEDGVQFSATLRMRWRSDSASGTRSNSAVGAASAFKSFEWRGFSHHVLAVRAAAAWADEQATSAFKVGGVSGQTLTVAPGVTIGEGRRTFPVRGFPAGAETGTRALGGSAEYRFPLSLPSGGLGMLPLFFQRVSGLFFADAATSWCPVGSTNRGICPPKLPLGAGQESDLAKEWLTSVGAELHLDAAYDYDSPYRFRLGVAVPLAGRKAIGVNSLSVFFALGLPF